MSTKKPARSLGDAIGIFSEVRITWRLFRDGRVSPLLKAIPLASLAYLIWPADLLPDVLLGLGQLDDLAVILLGLRLFAALCPAEFVREHRRQIAAAPTAGEDGVVDTTFRVLDDSEA